MSSTQASPPKIDEASACTCDHRLPAYRPCAACLRLEDVEMAYFMGISKKPKGPRAPDPDDERRTQTTTKDRTQTTTKIKGSEL